MFKFLIVGFLLIYFTSVSWTEWNLLADLATKEEELTTAHLWLAADFAFHNIGFWACLIMFWFGWGRNNASGG